LNLLNKKVTQRIKENFQVLSNYSNIMSEEFLKFELQTLKTQSESSLSSLASLQLKLLDLNKQVMSFQLTFDQQEIIKKQKLIESNEQKRSLTEIGLELSKVESKIKETETENESKSRSYQESLEKIKKNMEQNNQKISKIEQNIDFYCVNIEKLEQEGTTAAFKLTQLESSYKKTQEILSNALNERNRFLAQDSELKKQKIILTGKIDSLAEEKEKMIEKLSQIKHEKTLAEQELKERAQESQELKEKLTEISTKLEILEDKKFRLSQQVDESFDLKENLLAHRQKELIKLKDHLSFNVTQSSLYKRKLTKFEQKTRKTL
jgi:chromosome segregation ATPase